MTADEARALLGPALTEAMAALVAEFHDRDDGREHADGDRWPRFMRIETAAAYSDIPVDSIRKLIARGVIPVLQEGPGCRVLIEREALDAALRGWRR